MDYESWTDNINTIRITLKQITDNPALFNDIQSKALQLMRENSVKLDAHRKECFRREDEYLKNRNGK